MPAVAPYVAATTSRSRRTGGAAPRRAPLRGVPDRRIGVPRRPRRRDAPESPLPPRRGADRPRRDPDRHPRDGLEPRGGRVGRPSPARPAGGRERHRPAGRHPRRGRPGRDAGRAPRRRRDRRTVRPAGAARHPLRHRRGRPPGARRRSAVADGDVGGPGVLRHRPHQRLALRPRRPRGHALRRPVLPQARPAGGLRRPRHPPRPHRRRLAGGDQHVGRLRGADDPRGTAYAGGVAGHPRRVRRRPPVGVRTSSTPASCRCPSTGWTPSPRGTPTSSGATARGWSASSARAGSSTSTRPSPPDRASTTCGCWARRATVRRPRARRWCDVDGRLAGPRQRRTRLPTRPARPLPGVRPRR